MRIGAIYMTLYWIYSGIVVCISNVDSKVNNSNMYIQIVYMCIHGVNSRYFRLPISKNTLCIITFIMIS